MPGRLRRAISGYLHEWQALRGCYPDFVLRDVDALPKGDVPVFTFHTIEPEPFEAQLRHLRQNGYRTIDGAALLRHLAGLAPAPERSVMLTIDDGRKSVWTHGLPLLRRYGFRATVFLIPGYVQDGQGVAASLDDVWAGRIAAADLAIADPALMNWNEIRALQASGVIDCQSHTRFHHRVPIDTAPGGFIGPTTRDAFFDLPLPSGEEWRVAGPGTAGAYGMPLYPSASLMLARPRYHPPTAVVAACVDHVRRQGGAAYFARRDAAAQLRRVHDAARRAHGRGRMESPAEALAAIAEDLAGSRALIETALGGKPCTHLCFPYTEGTAAAVELAREAGFEAAYWGVLPDRRINRPGDDPLRIVRLKNDYIHRLPGAGRRSLGRIMLAKVHRRLTGGPIH
ncbi:MAG: polysaccharide deacetylase family protein [Geminicoccaceae bacterium]